MLYDAIDLYNKVWLPGFKKYQDKIFEGSFKQIYVDGLCETQLPFDEPKYFVITRKNTGEIVINFWEGRGYVSLNFNFSAN